VALQCDGVERVVELPAADAAASPHPAPQAREPQALRRGDTLYLHWQSDWYALRTFDPAWHAPGDAAQAGGLSAPMNGSIVRVQVAPGERVEAGAVLVILEAMKMEHSIRAPHAGTVSALLCKEGDMVSEGALLVALEAGDGA
ncbi:acetyl-CoA carboxylase biotin carboxyl carrier protein subunit, partial [Pseudomonas sp.]|uniref:acetyl-CoA carboxylase biotin carboxyl carrier protein subunit n=1 Tax=Pseudomonas sp. TaxID=306 RepID=UPI0028AABF0B